MSKHGKHGKNGKKAKGSARKKDKGKKARQPAIDSPLRSRLTLPSLPGLVAVAVGVALVAGITSLWRIRR